MRKFSLCVLLPFLSSFPALGQTVPNGNFESWKPLLGVEQPVGWFTSSTFTPDSDPKPVVKTMDKMDGDFAMQLETVKTTVGGREQVVQGMAVTGRIDLSSGPVVGFSLKGRPVALRFFYKYQPLFNDSMVVVLNIWKDDYSYPVGVAGFSSGEVETQYKMLDLTINYYTDEEPDSASISVFSGQDTVSPGSLLLIDNMSFVFEAVGIEQGDLTGPFGKPYPNPVQNETWFPISLKSPGKVILHIVDLSGKTVAMREKHLAAGDAGLLFDARNLKPGIYLYRLSSSGSTAAGKLVVE